MAENFKWWQRGVVYQIYPRSFMDASGDGVGDLRGIVNRLGYLEWLGADAVWISPFYPSPMADFGYDVSDHTDVHPMFGTLSDFDELLEGAHRRGIRVIVDYVPNHTSDEHPWFVESRSSRENPRRDWYLWRDPAPDGGPPNNWQSVFGGGSAWEWDAATEQYYYHAYLREQPDLNWRNPEVREAMMGVVRFWLERGVDGFRVDALRQLLKDEHLRDNPPDPDRHAARSPYDALLPVYSTDRPEVHEAVREMRGVLEEYDDRLLIGELYLPIDRLVTYYGENNSGVHLPFNFHLISTPWNAREISTLIDTYEAVLPPGGWPTWVLGNHDRSRIASRVGAAQARVAATLLLTLRGTPTIYHGDEIGMHDVEMPPELVQDPLEKNLPGRGLGRDPARTPMQWEAGPNAGFCPQDAEPWLPVANDYRRYNVATERGDQRSMLNLHRRLLELRRAEPALAVGSYAPVEATGDLLAYAREEDGRRFIIVLNFGHEPTMFDPGGRGAPGRIVLTTHLDREGEETAGALKLRGDEGVIIELTKQKLAR
jgi:alpha-glucosidase